MKKVVTFGELMLRLAPEGYNRFLQSDKFLATFGGGEANVAVSLANYGLDAAFVTKFPENDIAQMAINSLRKFGVDTSLIAKGGDRVGIYYCEKVLHSVLQRLYMTVQVLLLLLPPQQTLIGIKSSRVLAGSTLQALHQL